MVIIKTAYVSGYTEKEDTESCCKDAERTAIFIRNLNQRFACKGSYTNTVAQFQYIGKNKYHCHLSYHWVACWQETVKGIELEVYYAGSRENAPY